MTVLSSYRVEKGHIGPSDDWITHSCEEGHYCDLEGKTFKADKKISKKIAYLLSVILLKSDKGVQESHYLHCIACGHVKGVDSNQ